MNSIKNYCLENQIELTQSNTNQCRCKNLNAVPANSSHESGIDETQVPPKMDTQRGYLLQCLREHPCSTFELRQKGICSPAVGVYQLRKKGNNIVTTKRDEVDCAGVMHNIAVYTLLPKSNVN